MERLRTTIINALLLIVILAACSVALKVWWTEPTVEHVKIYRYAPGR